MAATRRYFLLGGMGVSAHASASRRSGCKSPNEKLNLAAIGAGGKGYGDIMGCAGENIVALADPDWNRAARTFQKFPKAVKYKDFRRMLDRERLDAVTVSTPDFMHAPAAIAAMERGLHVYVQKPMAHTVWEARRMAEVARKHGVATQMGNQGHSTDGVRELCETIWAGAIGNVREVHAWTNRPIWPQGIEDPLPEAPVPAGMDWETWLGTAERRPYNPGYAPFKWRGWWDFGCGALGDMACHILDAANWSLLLDAPVSVECIRQRKKNPYTFPTQSVVRFDFAARRNMAPVSVYWYEGGEKPPLPEGIGPDVKLGDGDNGSLFIGDKGTLTTGSHGENTRILSGAKDAPRPEKLLPRSPGHYRDWIRACKGGAPACSNFDYAAPFTEWVLLGVVAQRFEGRLLWDSAKMKVTNLPEANRWIRRPYRKGWKL